jgi:glycosyltransferase involved in cell wall biosynthesis
MVNHLALDRRLGGSRVQMDLADEFRRLGHIVDTYSSTDAFPRAAKTRAGELLRRPFWKVAPEAVRRIAPRYDVIDAQQGDLPVSKAYLGFDGLLVARSVGLVPFYEEFERSIPRRWSDQSMGNPIGRTLRARGSHQRLRSVLRSFREADLANVANEDERAYLVPEVGYERVVVLPFGLSHEYLGAVSDARTAADRRFAAQTVVAIGTWDVRKGKRDWPHIVEHVCAEVPRASFHFIGTGIGADDLKAWLPEHVRGAVRVTPAFEPSELPTLLEDATVAGLPSYIEGFPFAVIETLAAGIPTIAYDVPGPRETIGKVDPSALVPAGDTAPFADALVRRLSGSRERYVDEASRCQQLGVRYRWTDVAEATLDAYRERMKRLRSDGRPVMSRK